MRKPNGYGSIKKLSGNRRRPFVFCVSEDGRQKPVEYFTNQVDAEIYQADYNKIHYHRSLPGHKVTFAELYHRWLPAHIEHYRPITIKLNVGIEFVIMVPNPLIPLPRASNVDKLMILAPIIDCGKFPSSV